MNLSMIRGDTKFFKFQRKDASGDVITDAPDQMFFTVKEMSLPDDYLIQKTIEDMAMDENGVWRFSIMPEDTDELVPGRYRFDLQITADNVKTTVAIGQFTIEDEVTFASNEV